MKWLNLKAMASLRALQVGVRGWEGKGSEKQEGELNASY